MHGSESRNPIWLRILEAVVDAVAEAALRCEDRQTRSMKKQPRAVTITTVDGQLVAALDGWDERWDVDAADLKDRHLPINVSVTCGDTRVERSVA